MGRQNNPRLVLQEGVVQIFDYLGDNRRYFWDKVLQNRNPRNSLLRVSFDLLRRNKGVRLAIPSLFYSRKGVKGGLTALFPKRKPCCRNLQGA